MERAMTRQASPARSQFDVSRNDLLNGIIRENGFDFPTLLIKTVS
jgi:hypothetical protein